MNQLMNRQIVYCLLLSASAGIITPAKLTLAQTANLCAQHGLATEFQAQFSDYQAAVCTGGMNPTHMVVQSNTGTQSKAMPLDWVQPNARGEDPRTVGILQNGGWFYQAQNGNVTYKLIARKGRIIDLEIYSVSGRTGRVS